MTLDIAEMEPKKAFANIELKESDLKIVVVHNPDAKDQLTNYSWNLLLILTKP